MKPDTKENSIRDGLISFVTGALVISASVLLLYSCGGGGGSGGGDLPSDYPVSIADVSDSTSEYPFVAVVAESLGLESFSVLDPGSLMAAAGVDASFIYMNGNDILTFTLNSDGLISSITDQLGLTALIDNYTESTFDVTLIGSTGVTVSGPTTVNVGTTKLDEIRSLWASLQDFLSASGLSTGSVDCVAYDRLLQIAAWVNYATTASSEALCAVSGLTAGLSGAAGLPSLATCGPSMPKFVSGHGSNTIFLFIGSSISASRCLAGDINDCASAIADIMLNGQPDCRVSGVVPPDDPSLPRPYFTADLYKAGM